MSPDTSVLIIGSGAAGLSLALKVSGYADVTVITKKRSIDSNTYYAQGGIASVMDDNDSFDLHVADTLNAGQGLCDRKAVEMMVREGPERIRELIALGIEFDRDAKKGSFELGREGGHSLSRILHYGDMTGKVLEEGLIAALKKKENVRILQNHLAVDLLKNSRGEVVGATVLNKESNRIEILKAKATVLATGGAGKIYLYTSNPDVATGDGIAMAYRAGASVANLEFVQFHPTCLYHPDAKSFLISESLRGEGAALKNLRGEEFMKKYDERGELAPRDIVARAIDREMKKSGDKCVYLDISHKPRAWLKKRFPSVFETCLKFGIDISTQPIPVVPAAHYMCGGVKTDLKGFTDLPGLFAIGETACSGIHGANRLASNSLLEALVMGHRCSVLLKEKIQDDFLFDADVDLPRVVDQKSIESVILDHDWDLTRRVMWDYVGIVRSEKRLKIAEKRINQIMETIEKLYYDYGVSADIAELRNIALVSKLVVESALSRKESRGLHYMLEYPDKNPDFERDTILKKKWN